MSNRIVNVLDCHDLQGPMRYHVVQENREAVPPTPPDRNDEWINSLDGVDRVPYRLPELIASKCAVLITEGQTDGPAP